MSEQGTTPVCPSCGEEGAEGAQWCEACGSSMSADGPGPLTGPPCIDCGADHSMIVERYCGECGRKQPGERDHLTESLGSIIAVTDRGKRHHQNEDAFAIGAVGNRLVAVVCDGVSTTDNPQDASLAAANAARDSLVAALEAGEIDIEAALAGAIGDAQVAAAAVPTLPGGEGPASTTIVATVLAPDAADETLVRTWTAWLGDSRAYWVHEVDGAVAVTQLTEDHVWEHSITRWLGADANDTTPELQAFEHDAGGSLLLCSDGLWKYVPTEADLAALLGEHGSAEPLLALAESLVEFANESGGHDNTTIVIAVP